jgi:glycosyltransferase involved in cell wall biosynthesis
MKPLRVAVVADLLEERWPSMDLVAEMLVRHVGAGTGFDVATVLVRPDFTRRMTAMPVLASRAGAFVVDRFVNRLWDYPRSLSALVRDFDVFHVVDHSYSQLVHRLPGARTVVTCHDIDTFRSLVAADVEPRSLPFRSMTRHILNGLRKASVVACDSEATRADVIRHDLVPSGRTRVIPNGVDTACSPAPDAADDAAAEALLGSSANAVDLVHVGSVIPRKRIDVLLAVFADVRKACPRARLLRVGGPFTARQRSLAEALDLMRSIVVLPHMSRRVLAAIYRRASLALLVSEREGFGLPVLEAMACGTPMIASDLPVLREVGGTATTYCRVGDVDGWTQAVLRLLDERRRDCPEWQQRIREGVAWAARFTWHEYARRYEDLYRTVAAART